MGDGIQGTTCVLDRTLLVVNAAIDETASLGSRTVAIVNSAPGGGIAILANALDVVNPMPRITSVSPRRAIRGDSSDIFVSGENFISGVTSLDLGTGSWSIRSLSYLRP